MVTSEFGKNQQLWRKSSTKILDSITKGGFKSHLIVDFRKLDKIAQGRVSDFFLIIT